MILSLVWLTIGVGSSFSQDSSDARKDVWITEYGFAFTGTGDLPGYCLSTEYSRKLTEAVRLGVALGIVNFQDNDVDDQNQNFLLQNAHARSLELTGYFVPLQWGGGGLEIGGGGFYRHWNWIYATGANVSFSNGDITLDPNSYATQKINTAGYTASIGGYVRISEALGLNFRGVLQNDTNADIVTSARLGVRLKF